MTFGDGLGDDGRLALGERRVLDERELVERVALAPLPVAEELLDDAERLGGVTSPVTMMAELFGT